MQQDLFAALSVNKLNDTIYMLERRIASLFENRHEYPIWPYGDGNYDEFEMNFHEPTRHTYYGVTKLLIRTLRELKAAI